MFDLTDYDYELPTSLIAQQPLAERDASRVLVLDRGSGQIYHHMFWEIRSYLKKGDLLVINDTKVFPARLRGKTRDDKNIEVLLLSLPQAGEKAVSQGTVNCLAKKSRTLKPGDQIRFGDFLSGQVLEQPSAGLTRIALSWEGDIEQLLAQHGQPPLPPYIKRNGQPSAEDAHRYQTVFAQRTGSVAAPTAGFHFTENLIKKIKDQGTNIASVTLHVGYGTFAPVRVNDIRQHKMHAEYYEITEQTAEIINQTRARGNAVVAVGTTTTRALESAADKNGCMRNKQGLTDAFIYPGYQFKVVDRLITNFHLPRSTLLMLVSAFANREKVLHAYQEAAKRQYRFFSYGDAMLIL